MAGTLYIVATPIGNLDDMPPRVAATFGAADFIAAEDTRVTMKLLNFLGLKKPMVSYYEHALQKGEGILRRIEAGESCALCSDAGMPCVSDPGEVIVRDALARGIKVVPVPAASACVTALAVSGQDTSRWVFEGFLPVNRKQKKERLAELLGEKRTVIFYEAPHKLRTTLDDLTAAVDGRAFREEWAGRFDVVICDVPCSGLGIIRKKPDIRYKDAQEFSALPEIQRAILENSARYVKRGGLLVYSTCTILPEENEQVTDGFLKAHDEFTYEAFSLPNGVSAPGHLTLWPQRDNTDGFYLSRMRRRTHD